MSNSTSPPPYASSIARWSNGFVHLFAVSIKRMFWSRQTIVCAMLLVFAAIAVTAYSMRRERTPGDFIEEVFLGIFVTFLLPIYSLSYGAAGVSADREERTLVYLLVSPLPRALVFLSKGLAAITLASCWTLGALTVFCLLGRSAGREAWLPLVPPVFWATVAYVSLFLLFGVLFRRATIIALGYALFVETLIGNMPGIAKRLALSFYSKCLIFDAGAPLGAEISGPGNAELFGAVDGSFAQTVIYGSIVGFLALGAFVFSRREY